MLFLVTCNNDRRRRRTVGLCSTLEGRLDNDIPNFLWAEQASWRI